MAALRILACVKRVPAPGAQITLTDDFRAVDASNLAFTTSPHEECAVEEAIHLVEMHGGDITVLTVGPPEAEEQLRFSYARESGDWSVYGGRAPALAPRNARDSSDRTRSFAYGDRARVAIVAAMLGDTVRAREVVDQLPERAIISRAQVSALIARARGDTTSAIAALRSAASADSLVAHFGPPNLAPSYELLGDALLEARHPREAIAAYEMGLALMPNRSHALRMLARAQREAGDVAAASRTEAKLSVNWHAAERVRSP